MPECKPGRQIKRQDYSERDSGNFEFMRQKELGSLISVFDSQEAFSKKAQASRQSQAQNEVSYGHLQGSCREDENLERRRRREQGRH